MEKRRRTIGLLVSGIMDQFTESLCRGAMKECDEQDMDLVVFPGKYLDRDLSGMPEIMYEYQFNTIFDYARSHMLDGLVISAGNIGCLTGEENVRKLLDSYGDIPIALVASKWDGYISVNYDNVSGVREGMEYLLNELHCTRFAMLGGPDGNTDARERKEVFIEVLKEHGIPVTDTMIAYGNLERNNQEACNQLLDDNPDVEAIFCVNDDTALGLYDVMKMRGLVPGKDIMIFGYDNTITGSKAQPSLSTVGSDAVYLGQQAIHTMYRMLCGEQVDSVVFPAKFIRRNSITVGHNEYRENALMQNDEDGFFDEIFYRYRNEEMEDGSRLRQMFGRLMEQINRVLIKEHRDDKEVRKLLTLVDNVLDMEALDYADIDDLLLHTEDLYQRLCAQIEDRERHYEVRETLDQIYRKIIHNMDYKAGEARNVRQNEIYNMKIFVKESLQFRRGNDAAYASLLGSMKWLSVKNAYLYTFEEPIVHLYQEQFPYPEHVLIKAYIQDGELYTVPANQQRLKTDEIIVNEYIQEKRHKLVLMPLFYNEMQYGLLLCDLSDEMFSSGEFLTNQMGSAVHMIELLKENEKNQQQMEEMLVSLRENNIALDHLSKADSLTGIHNRRGYTEEAKKLIEQNHQIGQDTLIAYVDMDNLKIINDRYGHEEGDYSLKLISDILTEVIGEDGVVGRIGGDEYSFALTMKKDMEDSAVERRIHSLFTAHNKKSDKAYNVTVSIGMYLIGASEKVELEDALSYADEKLYVAKQHKVRTVEKN
ncbi:MAG: GGDEF domain-containing protein [Lachnospiraceae bacterium]|nr:GGDEF domain-containing protein [Lachnospiraceae bacterium]